jgi:LAO/AO transport system kinase
MSEAFDVAALCDAIFEGANPGANPGADPGADLGNGSVAGRGVRQRRAIAKAITLLESTRQEHRLLADTLLNTLLPRAGQAFRLGISGVPGVGKSTFIEALGLFLIAQGHRVAVLTVDPSSSLSGGSILGDKTRMEMLSVHPSAYIRPSPSSGNLGGVAEKTRESMMVFEAAGYDVVIVETVGVGQSETAVSSMTDMFVLMQLPNAGDELQAIKRGVMELADLVVVNKADLDADAATRAQSQILSSLRLFGMHGHPDRAHHDQSIWQPTVLQLSALKAIGMNPPTGAAAMDPSTAATAASAATSEPNVAGGLAAFWTAVQTFRELQTQNGQLAARRTQQTQAWMWERIESELKSRFRAHPAVQAALPAALEAVLAGRLAASVAARQLLELTMIPKNQLSKAHE